MPTPVRSASPPCTEYSKALTTRPRDLDLANRIVRRTLEIIEYLRPRRWWMENPDTGLLPRQDFMQPLAFGPDVLRAHKTSGAPIRVDYCRFSDWNHGRTGNHDLPCPPGYRKRTRIWYGGPDQRPLQNHLCLRSACPNMTFPRIRCTGIDPEDRKHRRQLSSHGGRPGASRNAKYRIPTDLVLTRAVSTKKNTVLRDPYLWDPDINRRPSPPRTSP